MYLNIEIKNFLYYNTSLYCNIFENYAKYRKIKYLKIQYKICKKNILHLPNAADLLYYNTFKDNA